jgi:F-type H+-transporting ATPase subunit a
MEISIAAEPIFHIGSFPVTNTLLVAVFITFIVFIASYIFKNNLKKVPRGFQNVIEYAMEAFLNLIDSITGDRKQTEKFFPIVMTIFIFVILSNWVELLPGLGTVGIRENLHGKEILVPFLRSSSADLNVTIALALVSVFSVQFMGIATIGAVKYAKKFFISPFHKPYFIGTFVGLLEVVGEVSRIISYAFRLFGNIFAGEVLLIVMLNLVPYIVPLPFLFLEMFVGFVQALVFSMLTIVFLKIGTMEAEH